MLDWPLDTLKEAAAQVNETVTCRSQWLVKRLVHRLMAAADARPPAFVCNPLTITFMRLERNLPTRCTPRHPR